MKAFLAVCVAGMLTAALPQLNYSEKKFGLSFRYPAAWMLKEGELDPDKDTGMGYLGPVPMGFAAPGGVRVATVEAPAGSWPGTDFVNAFFTLSVNSRLTNAECEQFADDLVVAPRKEASTISGIRFQRVRLSTAGLGHQFSGYSYHGFAKGSCYELGYGMATAGFGAVDGLKKVNDDEVFSILENILGSVKVGPVKIGVPANRRAADGPA